MGNKRSFKVSLILLLGLFVLTLIMSEMCYAERELKRTRRTRTKKKRYIKSKYGVRSLMQLSKDRGKMIKEYNKESKNFEKIEEAIDKGKIQVGELAESIRKRFGEPVVILSKGDDDHDEWVYKPGNVSFFEGPKIYLVFSEEEKLIRWEEEKSKPK